MIDLAFELFITIGIAVALSFFISGWWLVGVWAVAAVVSWLFIDYCRANPRGCGQ